MFPEITTRPLLCILLAGNAPAVAADPSQGLARLNMEYESVAQPSEQAEGEPSLAEGQTVLAMEALGMARHALQRGEPVKALHLLQTALEDQRLAPWVALLRARAILPDPQESPPDPATMESLRYELESVGAPPGLELEYRMLRDRCLVALGRGLDAREDLRALLNGSMAPEARYWLARAAEMRGDTEPALATYLATWIRHASSPWAQQAAERLRLMGHPVPDVSSSQGRAAALQRAEVLGRNYQAGDALELLLAIEKNRGGGSDPAWTLKMAQAFFSAKRYGDAVQRYQQIGSPTAASIPGNADTLFHHALASSRTGDYAGAARIYTILFQRYPSHRRADTASYKIGYLAFDEGRLEEAIQGFTAHLRRYPSSSHADEALWFTGWIQYSLGRSEQAGATWDRLKKYYPSSSLATAAQYWSARSLEGEARNAALRQVLDQHRGTGYAWFAARSLGTAPSTGAVGSPDMPPFSSSFRQSHPELELADALIAQGLEDWASALLEPLASKTGSWSDRIAMARRLVLVGQVNNARRTMGRSCGAVVGTNTDPQQREICKPRPHAHDVNAIVRGTGLDPYLPFAIMTAESAMQPKVTSAAGARGLMQLMPAVARELHEELFPRQSFDPDQLYSGAYNATLGSAELLRLYRHYTKKGIPEPLPLVIAAYNAGTEAVDRWLSQQQGTPDMDVFCENIGYTETRRYVRKVLGYLDSYHQAYDDY